MSNPEQSDFESTNNEASTSTDRFVDALITHRLCDSPQAMDRRLNRAMRAVRGGNYRLNAWQWWALPIAALLTLSFLFMPTSSSASALVRSATKVARLAADRRYEIVMVPVARNSGDYPPPIQATLDVRDAQHMRLEIRFPDGQTIVRGRDGAVTWDVGRDGEVRITDGSQPWPRWIETPDGSLLIDSMASMLDELAQRYTLTRVESTQCGGQSGLVQIDAARTTTSPSLTQSAMPPARHNPAQRIVMCIDPATNEVIRLEMQFPQVNGGPRGERGPPPPHGERGPPPPHGERGPPPPHGERGPPPAGTLPPPGAPQSVTYDRAALSAFPTGWFAAPNAQ